MDARVHTGIDPSILLSDPPPKPGSPHFSKRRSFTTRIKLIADEGNFVGYTQNSSAIVIADDKTVGYSVVENSLSAIV